MEGVARESRTLSYLLSMPSINAASEATAYPVDRRRVREVACHEFDHFPESQLIQQRPHRLKR